MTTESIQTHYISNTGGTNICLYKYPSTSDPSEPVILAHGLFSNEKSCRGLAQHLSTFGFDCWVYDSQGHGSSDSPHTEPNFESMCLQDTTAVLDFIGSYYPEKKLFWVGHSAGGLAILMYLCRFPQKQDMLKGIVTLASQSTDTGLIRQNRIALHIATWVTLLLGFVPGKLLKLGPENEFGGVMRQWFKWSLTGRWLGNDLFDYEATLSNLTVPCMMLAAKADHFIAPTSGCRRLYEGYYGPNKTFLICGKASGFIEDYTHSRIVSSRSAAKDIWPLISAWLTQLSAEKKH